MLAHIKAKAGVVRDWAYRFHLVPLFAVAIGAVILILFYAVSVQRDINREAAGNIEDKVSGIIRNISSTVEASISFLEKTAETFDAATLGHFTGLHGDLDSIARQNGFLRVNYVDLQGKLYLEDGGVLDVAEVAVYQEAFNKRVAISDPIHDESSGTAIVSFVVPITRAGALVGLLSGSKDFTDLSGELMRNMNAFEGYAYIIDNSGKIIFHADDAPYHEVFDNYYASMSNLVDGCDGLMEKIKADLNEQRGGTVLLNGVSSSSGERFHGYIGYEPIAVRADWNIVCFAPMDSVAAYNRRILAKSVILTAALILLLTLAVYYIMRVEKQRRREIDQIQDTDALTGAASYSKFCRDAAQFLRENKTVKYAFSYSDIRGFKLLNDTLGYEMGDRVLRYFAQVLRENLGANETFARVSGDNFVIIETYAQREDLVARFERISTLVQDFDETKKIGFTVRICSGILCVEDLGEPVSVSGMLDRANYAQKKVKNSGLASCSFYTEEIREQVLLEQELENRMEEALENGEFEVFYQPKFIPETNGVAGAEALVRWRDQQHGFLSPSVFIPLFERNHFIARLDRYIFEQVCKDLSNWMQKGNEAVRVSVNVSRMQLRHTDFIGLYSQIRDKYKIPIGLIEVEFTESIAYENMDAFSRIVGELHQNGFLCSLDDFGSGYSSLGCLGSLSVDVLKLDRQFFHMEDEQFKKRGDIVVQSVISMAHQLNMETVAEGVETQDQLDTLREMGCDLVQGYVYAKPMPRVEFEEMLHALIKREAGITAS